MTVDEMTVVPVAPPRRRDAGPAGTAASRPRSAHAHLVRGDRAHLFVVDGSRLYDVDDDLADALDAVLGTPDELALLHRLGVVGMTGAAGGPGAADIDPQHLDGRYINAQYDARYIDDTVPEPPPVHALSLAVAQRCNLACTYCYAQQGDFGGPATSMPLDVALASVEVLLRDAGPGDRRSLAFLGGEPLVNRAVLRATTEHAAALGAARGVDLRFSLTTNGTLLTADDAEFLEAHGFAVTVSLDGPREAHDALRPYRDGRGSFDVVMRRVAPLLARQQRMQVSARVTVTARNLAVRRTVDELVAAGFHTVGVSPMLSAPGGHGELGAAELDTLLGELVACADEYERRLSLGERYPFANLLQALREIDRGTHRPYPCGAGAGYLGVAAGGELSACHRFVGEADAAMGSVHDGVDDEARAAWLATRHVHRQEPCTRCWARYLCGGGCHHEVVHRGRPACDFIRGWLHHCLGVYGRVGAP